jgi:hypothetical protein
MGESIRRVVCLDHGLKCRMYLAVALFFITNLFSLYRLSQSTCQLHGLRANGSDWWPSALGGRLSYGLSWGLTLLIGLATHHLDLFKLRRRWESRDPANDVDWERKSESFWRAKDPFVLATHRAAFWVTLSFVAMLMPAVACFSKLKRDKRHTLRNPVPSVSQTSDWACANRLHKG